MTGSASSRYAVYFAPAPESPWGRFGKIALAGEARRYGFHATLKAPFRLREGTSFEELLGAADAFADSRTAFCLPPMKIARLDDFVALVPQRAEPRLDALAEACVREFERFRAPPTVEELARRRRRPLTSRQEALLAAWGYPYVMEEFRFHLSLTGPGTLYAPSSPALPKAPLIVDAITIFQEPEPVASFVPIHRARLRAGGRLLYVAGPSGAGKDAILGWAKRNLPEDAPVAFARRAITRARDGVSEDHEALSVAEFEARLARGEFAMAWTANGHRYGIGAEIREWLARGLTVVVSGSREYLPHARREFPDLEVVLVTASPEVLRERLAGRGRESADMIALRLERTDRFPPAGRVAAEVHNDGALDAAGQRFLKLLSKEMSGT